MNDKTTVHAFATTAAALFIAACGGGTQPAADASSAQPAAASTETVKCLGINACKGQSQCGVEGAHGCAGQNACKGKGWIKVAAKECTDQGGTVL